MVAALFVAGITAVPLAAGPDGLVVHFECVPGATVATEDLWTPWVLVDAPYGGFANGTGSLVNGVAWSTGAVNGSVGGVFELADWTIAVAQRALALGPGPNAVCPSYLATLRWAGDIDVSSQFGARNATSDTGQNVTISFNGYDSVMFQNGYSETDLTVGACNGASFVLGAKATRIAVEVPFTVDGANETAAVTLAGAFNYSYSFPAGHGLWSIDDLNVGAHAPGGGYAFSFAPCG